jgi:hypothetical protein
MSSHRPPPPHANVHLPSLDGHEALRLVNILDRIISAVWRAHGHSMRATLEELSPPLPPASRRAPSPSNTARNQNIGNDDLLF